MKKIVLSLILVIFFTSLTQMAYAQTDEATGTPDDPFFECRTDTDCNGQHCCKGRITPPYLACFECCKGEDCKKNAPPRAVDWFCSRGQGILFPEDPHCVYIYSSAFSTEGIPEETPDSTENPALDE